MIDWWTGVGLAISAFLDRHGLLAAFVFLLIEEAGVPVPVPGDVLMIILGVHARSGAVPLWQAIGVAWIATLIGSTFLYFITRAAGRTLVYRYGRYIRLTPERLDQADKWLKHHGSRAVFVGRLVPGLRILTGVACGVFEVPFRVFFPAMALGALTYIAMYTLLGYFLGLPVLRLLEDLSIPIGLVASLVALAIMLVWTFRARREIDLRPSTRLPQDVGQQARAGAIAGGLATIASTLLINVVVNLAGNIAFDAPGTIVERTAARIAFALARDVQPVLLFVAVPAFVGVGIFWGAVYALWGERLLPTAWPDWLKGLVYSVLPLVVSLGVVMPLLGLGFLGGGATGPVVAIGELIRHAAYGVMLGLVSPISRGRRLPTQRTEVPPHSVAGVEA